MKHCQRGAPLEDWCHSTWSNGSHRKVSAAFSQFTNRVTWWKIFCCNLRSTAILRAVVVIVRAGMRHPDQLKCLVSASFFAPVIRAAIFRLGHVFFKKWTNMFLQEPCSAWFDFLKMVPPGSTHRGGVLSVCNISWRDIWWARLLEMEDVDLKKKNTGQPTFPKKSTGKKESFLDVHMWKKHVRSTLQWSKMIKGYDFLPTFRMFGSCASSSFVNQFGRFNGVFGRSSLVPRLTKR